MSNGRLVARLQSLSRFAAIFAIAVGCLVISGWLFNIEIFKSLVPGLVAMKFNTALAFVLTGIGLLNLQRQPRITLGLAIFVALLGLLTFCEYLFNWNLGIDQWLLHDGVTTLNNYPGRMSPVSAVNFFLIGSSLLLVVRSRRFALAQSLIVVVEFTALLSLIGYVLGIQSLYKIGLFSSIALHTTITFMVLGLAIFFLRPKHGLATIIVTDRAGGLLARRLLPLVVVFSLLLGWLRLKGEQAGLYETEFGVALLVLGNIVVFTSLLFWTARSLNRIDARRAEEEAQRRQTDEANKRYGQRLAMLHAIDIGILQADSIPTVVEVALKHLRDLIPCQRADVTIVDETTGDALIFALGVDRNTQLGRGVRVPIPPHVFEGYDARNIRTFEDIRLFQETRPRAKQLVNEGLLCALSVLLMDRERPIGTLGLFADTPNFFSAEDQEIAIEVASQIAIAINQLHLSEEVLHYTRELERHVAELTQAEAELHQVNEHLEVRVQERTSELNHLNKTLRANEEKLQTIFNVLPVGAALLNTDRQIIQVNRALEKILDLSMDELLKGKYKSRIYIHANGTPVQANEFPSARAHIEQQTILDVEMGVIKEDGETIWTSVSAAPLPGNQGVVTVTVDLTKRKQAEAALRESERHLRLLAQNSPDIIYIMDLTQQRASYLNRPEFLGYSQSEIEASGSLLSTLHPEDKERVLAHWQAIMMAPPLKEVDPVEYRLQDKQGRWQWIQSRERIFASTADGKPAQILVTLTVITDRKQAEQQTRELEQERQRVKMLSDFVKNTSHDFRTPLTIISSSLYLLSKSSDPEKQKRHFESADKQITHLTYLLERLLEMGRLDSLITLASQPLDVNPLLADLCAKLSFQAREKAVTVLSSIWGSRLMVQADFKELSLALAELGKNALGYTPLQGTITLRTWQEANEAVIEVADTGMGIAPVHLPHIFERLYRVDESRSLETGGTGLGLSIAKRIIDLHHGRIVVESVVGAGSLFRVFLPLSP